MIAIAVGHRASAQILAAELVCPHASKYPYILPTIKSFLQPGMVTVSSSELLRSCDVLAYSIAIQGDRMALGLQHFQLRHGEVVGAAPRSQGAHQTYLCQSLLY